MRIKTEVSLSRSLSNGVALCHDRSKYQKKKLA